LALFLRSQPGRISQEKFSEKKLKISGIVYVDTKKTNLVEVEKKFKISGIVYVGGKLFKEVRYV